MPVPITWRSCRSMSRPVELLVEPADHLDLGGAERRVAQRRIVGEQVRREVGGAGEPREEDVTRGAARGDGDQPDPLGRHVGSPRVEDPDVRRGARRTRRRRGSDRSAGSRTPATNSVQLVEAPMTTDCCHAETRVRPRSRTPTTTKTRWSASPRRTRWTCRGRHRPSSSSEMTTRSPAYAAISVEQPVEGSGHGSVARPAPAGRGGRRPPSAARAGRAGRGRRWRRGRPRVRRARTGSWSCPSWADRRAGRRQPLSFPPSPGLSVLRGPGAVNRACATLGACSRRLPSSGGPPDRRTTDRAHPSSTTAAHGRPFRMRAPVGPSTHSPGARHDHLPSPC